MKPSIFLKNGFFASSLTLLLFATAPTVFSQKFDALERERAREMLKTVKSEIKKNYYDAEFRGKDLDAHFKNAESELNKASSLNQAVGIIAQTVLDFDDSHTVFLPPARASKIEYGWQMTMIGDKCLITAIKPGSDAEAKGLKPGDQILMIDGFRPTRQDLWIMQYYYYTLSPRSGVQLTIASPNVKEPRQLNVAAKIKQLERFVDLTTGGDIFNLIREAENENRLYEHRFKKVGNVVIWNMPTFAFDPEQVDGLVNGQVKDGDSLVLDLRGNPGGYVVTLEKLTGYFFDRDIKIAELKGRKEMKPQEAKSKGKSAFKGKIVVLIDSRSGSAAEVFARLIQLEKRGLVIGDKSAGAVMQSRSFVQKVGVDTVVFYGVSVTNADVIMSDGKSLEKVGVTPDELLLPTGADLAAKHDPVLARGVEIAGAKIAPEEAGKFFPILWRR